MRIGLLLTNPSPHQVDFLNAMSKRDDIDAFVVYEKESNPSRSWGAPTPDLEWKYFSSSMKDILTNRVCKWFKMRRVDIVVLGSVYTHPLTHIVAFCLRSAGIPFVFFGEPPKPNSGARALIQSIIISNIERKSSGILTTGVEASRRYQRIVKGRIPVASLPYYIDLNELIDVKSIKYVKEGSPIRFVTSAQLIHRKGIDVLLDACEMLPDEGWSLDIYGAGPLEATLKDRARAFNKKVYFRGVVPYENRFTIYRVADVFVFPSRWDGWGMVVPEAMAHGLPVITTDQVMSSYDFITDNKNGFVGPRDCSEFLWRSMEYFLNNKKKIKEFSMNTRGALAEYRPELGVDKLMSFLRSIIT